MAIESADLRQMLDDAWDAAPDGEGTLRLQLRAFEKQDAAALEGGSLQSVSANGRASSFITEPGSGITLADKKRAWRTLIDVFDAVYAAAADQTDEAVYAAMKLDDRLHGVPVGSVILPDFSCLNYP